MKRLLFVFILLLCLRGVLIAGDYGVVKDGFPSWEERTVLVWTNRARSDPVADLKDCTVCADKDCYRTPSRPLTYDYNLNRAARFHSTNLVSCGGTLMHDSPCTLVDNIGEIYLPGSCDGSASCACKGGICGCNPTCTSWSSRISMFVGSPSGENAAYGYSDPVQTFYQWLWEPESSSACGFRYTNGHRVNILNDSHASIGIGNYQSYWTQDFSYSSRYKRRLYSGTHYPKSGGNIEFRANWADSAPPSKASVVIDGMSFDMEIERGSGTNGTYIYKATLPKSCHNYYFLFRASNGEVETFPDEGAYGVNCNYDYTQTREEVDGGYVDSGTKDTITDTSRDSQVEDHITIDVIQDKGMIIDVISSDSSEDAIEIKDAEFKRDSYPDYVNENEGGCSCSFLGD